MEDLRFNSGLDFDTECMQLALQEAARASDAGEVPVGAVIVRPAVAGRPLEVIAVGRNACIGKHDPSAHAEIEALRAAGAALGNYRLPGLKLYVTLEPCAMCAGAMMHARLDEVIFAAHDPKTGVAGSVCNLFESAQLNHQTKVRGGVLAEEAAQTLQAFFARRRKEQKTSTPPQKLSL